MIELFGFSIQRKEEDRDIPSFAVQEVDDGALTVSAGGAYGTYLDLEGSAKTEAEIVAKYREMSIQPECERAIDQLVNEAIIKDGNKEIVDISLDNLDISDNIKSLITAEFNTVSELLNINNYGFEIFRRWYIDGRLFYHVMIDENNPRAGVQELRYIDPRKIRKIRAIKRERRGRAFINVTTDEFYMYNERGFRGASATGMDNQGLRIAKDSIIHVTSGLMDKDNKIVLGYMHKAIKPLNQLRILEDATIIYRISRAPERRIFYIDVGNLPKMKAEQYVKDMMTKHKNRLVYDATTGDIRDDRKFMTMLEDYWLPRREGGKGTEISTLPSGQNLGELSDVNYFEKKLFQSLNVPMSRMNPDQSGFNLGRAAEISQDELNFQKFIGRLHLRFSQLFLQVLEKQLILKAICTSEEWEIFKNKIQFNFNKDNYHSELKDAEVLRERLNTLQLIQPYIGLFYSTEWIFKNVLMMSDEDIKSMQSQMKKDEIFPGSLLDQEQQQQAQMDMMQQGQQDAAAQADPSASASTAPKAAENKAAPEKKEKAEPKKDGRPYKTQIVHGKSKTFTRKQHERLPSNF